MAYFFDETPKQRRERYLRPFAEENIDVLMGVIFPFTPVTSIYRGEDPQKVLSNTIASGLTTWLIAQSMGASIPFGGIASSRQAVFSNVGRSVSTVLSPAVPLAAAVVVTDQFVDFHKSYQPAEPTHQPSWWNSIASALSGNVGGIDVI